MGADVKKLGVFATRKVNGGVIWASVGVAFVNRDGSISVSLDALPIDGKLHMREVTAQANPALDVCKALVKACDEGRSGCGIIGPHHEGRNHSRECAAAREVVGVTP